jgi:hypothetical protein
MSIIGCVPDEDYWAYLMKIIERTWWRLLSVPDEDHWAYLMKIIERTWWRLLSVPDEDHWAYLMKIIERVAFVLFAEIYKKKYKCCKSFF